MRETEYLKGRYRAMLSSVGVIFLLAAGVMLLPLSLLPAYPAEARHALAFCAPAGCLAVAGVFLWRFFRPDSDLSLSVDEGGVIVLISWVVVSLFSAWPFMSVLGLPFSRALFESVSGWTTTGLSVVDVAHAGPTILLWRSITQLAGGAGLAIIMMSAIVGPAGVGISSAEGRGDQLVPQVRQSARLVLTIYACYAGCGTLAYWLAGMPPFDAFNHSFAAVSTGGFSTRPESIGYWDSPAVEGITLFLMFLGNLSFVTAWFLWRGKFRLVSRNGELRLFGVIIPLAAAAIFFWTCRSLYPQLGRSIRVALFQTVSALTTTGFSTVGYDNWNSFGIVSLVLLMVIGGGTCSTAGGLKQFRVYLWFKLVFWEFRRHFMPRTAILARPVWEGSRRGFVDDRMVRHLAVFTFFYMGVFLLGVLLLCGCGYSLAGSFFEFASAIGTVGLSVGLTFAGMPDLALWAEILAMFLGRLEFIVVIVSLVKLARDVRFMLLRGEGRP